MGRQSQSFMPIFDSRDDGFSRPEMVFRDQH
jgi:hypothetical protein